MNRFLNKPFISYEIIITAVLFCYSIYFSATYKKRKSKGKLRKKVLADGDNDYKTRAKNIALGIANGKDLYKELIVKVHPDKFSDDKKGTATLLSQRITDAKRNYNELCKIEEDVIKFLNQ